MRAIAASIIGMTARIINRLCHSGRRTLTDRRGEQRREDDEADGRYRLEPARRVADAGGIAGPHRRDRHQHEAAKPIGVAGAKPSSRQVRWTYVRHAATSVGLREIVRPSR